MAMQNDTPEDYFKLIESETITEVNKWIFEARSNALKRSIMTYTIERFFVTQSKLCTNINAMNEVIYMWQEVQQINNEVYKD